MVRENEGPGRAAKPPAPRDKLVAFAPAPPGWVVWVVDLYTDDTPTRALAVAGFATMEGPSGAYLAPMVSDPEHRHALVDPRSGWCFLLLAGPGEVDPQRVELAEKRFRQWHGYRAKHAGKRRDCPCGSYESGLCLLEREAMIYRESNCLCECHDVARGDREVTDEGFEELRARRGWPPKLPEGAHEEADDPPQAK